MKIAVVSGRYPASTFDSHINHRAYCYRHGYTYIHCSWPTRQTNPYMNKIEYLKEYYQLFDYIFWIDDDAFFLNFDWKLESIMPGADQFLTICKSPSYKTLKTYVSSGQFLLKCNLRGREFIDRLLMLDFDLVKKWWPRDEYFFSGGDQDKITYLLCNEEPFRGGALLLEHAAFNSRFEELETQGTTSGVNVLHFTGRVPVKTRDYRKAQRLLRRGPSLLPLEVESELRLRNPSLLRRITKFFI